MSTTSPRPASPDTIPDVPTRRAMVGSAMAGIDRFKKSWMSVMVLKSSIGLGQVGIHPDSISIRADIKVVALITLLILANTLDSPLAPSAKQSVPSDACPNPHLFQAWIGVNMARLAICWCVSCWMVLRHHRSRAREEVDPERSSTSYVMYFHTHSWSRELTHRTARPASAIHIPHSDTLPSLSHSASSTSSSTLADMSSSSHGTPSPETIYNSTMGSTLSLDALAAYAMEPKQTDDHSVGPRLDDRIEILDNMPRSQSSSTLAADEQVLQAARDFHAGRETPHLDEQERPDAFAVRLDRIAPT